MKEEARHGKVSDPKGFAACSTTALYGSWGTSQLGGEANSPDTEGSWVENSCCHQPLSLLPPLCYLP